MGPLLGIMILFNFELDLAKRRMGGGDEYPVMDSTVYYRQIAHHLALTWHTTTTLQYLQFRTSQKFLSTMGLSKMIFV